MIYGACRKSILTFIVPFFYTVEKRQKRTTPRTICDEFNPVIQYCRYFYDTFMSRTQKERKQCSSGLYCWAPLRSFFRPLRKRWQKVN